MAMSLLADKVAVVTGAARGIGRENARVPHSHLAQVVLRDLDCDARVVSMKRVVEPGEIAGAVVFPASELSGRVTGAALEVGDGRYM